MPDTFVSHPTRQIKVLIAGSFSTGKTTLCRDLVSALQSNRLTVTYVEDVARRCTLPLNEDQTIFASLWLAGEQIRAEADALSSNVDVVLCDRSFPDILSHTALIRRKDAPFKQLSKVLVQMARTWCKTYDLVFTTRVAESVAFELDGLRSADNVFRRQLQDTLDRAFTDIGILPCHVPTMRDAACVFVVDKIKSAHNPPRVPPN